ncbi:MAG TPA: hypothetical protein VFK32_06640 [Tepidiformaceae bacterium]|nr:hypothetical protein [Tepidiformaceae bacterium]
MNSNANLFTPARSLLLVLLATGLVLMGLLIAMQFSDSMAWSPFDFAALAVLLLGGGFLFTLGASRARDIKRKTAIGAVVAFAVLLLAVELGVGLVGSPIAGS